MIADTQVDIFAKDLILVPVNIGGMHWTAAAINNVARRIEYYDSMGDRGGHRAKVFSVRTYRPQDRVPTDGRTCGSICGKSTRTRNPRRSTKTGGQTTSSRFVGVMRVWSPVLTSGYTAAGQRLGLRGVHLSDARGARAGTRPDGRVGLGLWTPQYAVHTADDGAGVWAGQAGEAVAGGAVAGTEEGAALLWTRGHVRRRDT